MAILKDGDDEYEVRIKRYPDKTYFEEHIKIGDRERPGAKDCSRYIVGEEGTTYTIELTLRKGFTFGKFDRVRVKLYFEGHTNSIAHKEIFRPADCNGKTAKDITTELEYADVVISGRKVLGARFAFRGLKIDEKLDNETDIMGVDPQSLGNFRVRVYKLRWEERRLSDAEYSRKVRAAPSESQIKADSVLNGNQKTEQNLWDAQKVDEDTFKKDGITLAVGFVGGTQERTTRSYIPPPRPISTLDAVFDCPAPTPTMSRTQNFRVLGDTLQVVFYYRTADFLQRTGIVKYPPPLHVYRWEQLELHERKTALSQLQVINKDHVHQALEAKSRGFKPKFGKGRKQDEPKEWRSWTKMYDGERKQSYETLQKAKKAHERGEVQRQFENNNGEIISLIDEDDHESKSKKRDRSAPKLSPGPSQNRSKSEGTPVPKKDPKVKNEGINPDEPSSSRAGLEKKCEAAPAGNHNIEDDELERKEKKARALAEEIEAEERLAKLKRERRVLEDEIDAARKKKQKLGED